MGRATAIGVPAALSSVLGKTLRPDHVTIDCVGSAAASETASRVEQAYVSCGMNELPGLAADVVAKELRDANGEGKVVVFCP